MTHDQKLAAGCPGESPAIQLHPGRLTALLLAAMVLFVCGCSKKIDNHPVAAGGVMDLSAWEFSRQGIVDLKGDWEFYWNRLLAPEDFKQKPLAGTVEYMSMPSFWNDHIIAGRKLPGHGYATMRLAVRVGGGKNLFSMIVPQMHTAYRLWANGKEVASNGKIGTDKAHESPEFLPKIVVLATETNILELVLQVSNFHHPRGGMWSSIKLGSDAQIITRQRHLAGFHSFLLGGLLLMAVYQFGVFLFRRKDLASLFFSILCLVMALRIPLENDRMMLDMIPWLGWEATQKISYFTLFCSLMIMNLYLFHLFPDIYSRAMVRASNAISAVFCLAVIVLTAQIYFYTRYPFYVNMLFFVMYDVYVIVRSVIQKKEGAAYLTGGMVVLLATTVMDILYHDRIIDFGNVSSFGVLIFTISQAMLLSDRSSRAFMRIEVLSSEKAQLFASSIDIISSILLASSTRLFEYTQNVTRIAVMLARHVGLGPDGVEEIRIASLLHDIGMVGHAEELHGRANLLSGTERLILENHPRKSNEIIENLKGLAGVKKIIAQHHERYNGSGYPSRLAGKEIVIGARIIGLVDDFVAMLGRREYQTDDKKGRIIAELVRQKGLLYDPVLVDALIQLIEKINLVYIIDENDILYEKNGNVSEWVFPSNVNYEMSVVEKVIAEVKSRASVRDDIIGLVEAGLGEVIRNAIIHGNKYDEAKRVTVTVALLLRDGRNVLEFRITDQGGGMDLTRYNHFKEGRLKLYDIVREMKQRMHLLESHECRDVFGAMNRKLQEFLMDYFINYNQYRRLESPEATGGIGLIQVMQTFDNVDFRPVIVNHALCGMEVVLEKFID
ncbi:MAG TPA: 7TM diverse intracellular signaling domain-containing protein [Spirochaetota bacterium]|nr:7TM diverse intracellular signaling domain-containing protein [Spirochaetota bacterium]